MGVQHVTFSNMNLIQSQSDKINYLFQNINGYALEEGKYIGNFIPVVLGMWLPMRAGMS